MDASGRVLAVDPGTDESAFVLYDGERVHRHGIVTNDELLRMLPQCVWPNELACGVVACEMIQSFGMAVGREVFETCVWIGRFMEASPVPFERVYRKDVKMHLCGTPRAKDGNVRVALLDRFGPGKALAQGTKKKPGPLYGIRSHEWAALAVAVTFADTHLLARLQQGASNE